MPFSVVLGSIYDLWGKYREHSLKQANPLTLKIIMMILIHTQKLFAHITHNIIFKNWGWYAKNLNFEDFDKILH